ncbi:MAG: hypothetical protein ACRDBO_07055 [Lachnospiraceae bacterium]
MEAEARDLQFVKVLPNLCVMVSGIIETILPFDGNSRITKSGKDT